MAFTETARATEFITLKGGMITSVDALKVLWRLEDSGFTVRAVGDRLQVLPVDRQTPDVAVLIRQHRDELLDLVKYQPPEV